MVNQQSNIPDLQIRLRDGRNFNVNLDRSETLGDIEAKIETAVGGATVLDVQYSGDQLYLKDRSTPVTTLTGNITAAANASTIAITTASTLGLVNSQIVTVTGVGGNTAANGNFFIKVINSTTFELYKNPELTVGQSGNGAFTSGGTWSRDASKFRVAAVGDNTSVSPSARCWELSRKSQSLKMIPTRRKTKPTTVPTSTAPRCSSAND